MDKVNAFITKYALTDGIAELEGEILEDKTLCIRYPFYNNFYKKKEYFIHKSEAIKDAEARRIKKIKSLEKQIAKLQNMKFEV